MKKVIFILPLFLACKEPPLQKPVGQNHSDSAMEVSKSRAKTLNEKERELISEWIKHQKVTFYSTSMNYWVDIKDFKKRSPRNKGEKVSYQYQLYDFTPSLIYEKPIRKSDQVIGKINDLMAVQDAIKYLKSGESATLLVPSVLAFGTYGDNDKIQNDVPLIIKIKMN